MENTNLTDNNLLQYYNLIEEENHKIWEYIIKLNVFECVIVTVPFRFHYFTLNQTSCCCHS